MKLFSTTYFWLLGVTPPREREVERVFRKGMNRKLVHTFLAKAVTSPNSPPRITSNPPNPPPTNPTIINTMAQTRVLALFAPMIAMTPQITVTTSCMNIPSRSRIVQIQIVQSLVALALSSVFHRSTREGKLIAKQKFQTTSITSLFIKRARTSNLFDYGNSRDNQKSHVCPKQTSS